MFKRIIGIYPKKLEHFMLSYYPMYNFGVIKKFILPDLGEKIKEATIKKWHVKEGDLVDEFQALADVSTDKLFTQIPSSEKGKIHKRCFKEEENCSVGDVLLEIEVDEVTTTVQGHEVSDKISEKNQRREPEQVQQESSTEYSNAKVLMTPAVRNMVRQNNIDATKIVGTGRDGRILKEDIINYLNQSDSKEPQKPAPKQEVKKPEEAAPKKEITPKKEAAQLPKKYSGLIQTQINMNNFQKGMQKSMTEALTIPQFNYKDEFDITDLHKLREDIKKHYKGLTITPFFIKAFSLALLDFPILNSHYDKENPFVIKQIANHNISFAIDSPNGLIVPNIKNCQNLSILEINQEMMRIKAESDASRLGFEDLKDGTISISNIGMEKPFDFNKFCLGNIGGTYLGPIILPPQVCIVALGKAHVWPRYVESENNSEELKLAPRRIVSISFSADHRVLDGATVARFSNKWKSYLEDPKKMILNLK